MKHLVVASIFCLMLRAQEQTPVPQLVAPSPNIGVWHAVQQQELLVPHELKLPSSLVLTFPLNQSTVCSVPLLEAHTNVSDPGITTAPRDNSVAIRQAHVPAPSCQK